MTYAQKLRDPRWQKKRLEILNRDNFKCTQCGDSESTLSVHHKRYFKGREPWEYDGNLLITVCDNCHKTIEFHKELALDFIAEGDYAFRCIAFLGHIFLKHQYFDGQFRMAFVLKIFSQNEHFFQSTYDAATKFNRDAKSKP